MRKTLIYNAAIGLKGGKQNNSGKSMKCKICGETNHYARRGDAWTYANKEMLKKQPSFGGRAIQILLFCLPPFKPTAALYINVFIS